MKQIETLNRIRARCVELLEQAKLRTPGAWRDDAANGVMAESNGWQPICYPFGDKDTERNDATYIANASVAFEAALESTIAAIDGIERDMAEDSPEAEAIIAAWQHLLQ